MDSTFIATPMVADAIVTKVKLVILTIVARAISLIERVAPQARPSRGGTSLSAVSPDHNFLGGTA